MNFWDGDYKPVGYSVTNDARFSYRLKSISSSLGQLNISGETIYTLKPGRTVTYLTVSPVGTPTLHCKIEFIAHPGHSYQGEIRGLHRCIVIDKTTGKIVASKDFR